MILQQMRSFSLRNPKPSRLSYFPAVSNFSIVPDSLLSAASSLTGVTSAEDNCNKDFFFIDVRFLLGDRFSEPGVLLRDNPIYFEFFSM